MTDAWPEQCCRPIEYHFTLPLTLNWWGNSSNDRTDIKTSVSVKISIDLGFIRSHTSFCLWLLRYFLKSPPSISSSISNSSPRGSDVIPKQRTMFLWSNLLCERDTYIPYILLQTVKLSNYFFSIWNKIHVPIKENLVTNYRSFLLISRGLVLVINEMKSSIAESINLYCK